MTEPSPTPAKRKLQPSLLRQDHPLAAPARQLQILADLPLPEFSARLQGAGLAPLRAHTIAVLQVNLGKRCNQTCQHCHVDAGPDRREVMPDTVVDACLALRRIGHQRAERARREMHECHQSASAASRASGRAPKWEMISAAATLPSRPQAAGVIPRERPWRTPAA